MGTELATAYIAIVPSARGITGQLEKELAPLAKAGDDAGNKAGRGFASSFEAATGASLASFGKKALVGAAALGVGLFGVAKAAGNLSAAIAANEQVLGDASAAVQAWAKDSVQNVGLSERAALEAATSFGQLAKVAGLAGPDVAEFSKKFVVLAADMAAFKDVPVQQALEDLQGGFAGQTEVLRKYGIFLDDATLKAAYFAETGQKVTGTLTAQQRVTAAAAAIFQATGDIQGQAAREAGGFARAQDNLKASMENAAASIGAQVLPTVTTLLNAVTKGVTIFANLNEATGGVVGKFALFATGALVLLGSIALITSKVASGIDGLKKFGDAVGGLRNISARAGVALGIAGVALVGFALYARESAKDTATLNTSMGKLARVADEGLAQGLAQLINFGKATGDVKDLAGAIEKLAGEQPGLVARLVEVERATGGVSSAFDEYGIKVSDGASVLSLLEGALAKEAAGQAQATATTDAGAEALARFGSAGADAADGVGKLGPTFDDLIKTTGKWRPTFDDLITGADGSTKAVTELAKASEQLDVVSDMDRWFQEARQAADGFAAALDGVFGSATDLEGAADATRQNIEDLSAAMKDNGKTLDENTAAGRANREQVRTSVDGITEYARKLAESGATTDEVTAKVDYMRGALVQQVMSFGLSEDAANAYVNQLGLTPEAVRTAVELAGDAAAKERIQAVIDKMGNIDPRVVTEIQALIDSGSFAEAERLLAQLSKDRLTTIRVQTLSSGAGTGAGGTNRATATGGFFPGGTNQWRTFAENPGRKGDEVALPLGDPSRMSALLAMPQVFGRVMASMPRVEPATAGVGGGVQIGTLVAADTDDAIRKFELLEWRRRMAAAS